MKSYIAHIDIMPHEELLDPQGKAATRNMRDLDLTGIEDIRIGKHIRMKLTASDETDAEQKVDRACRQLLANPIIEGYTYHLEHIDVR